MIDIKKLKKMTSAMSILYVEDDGDIRDEFEVYLKNFFNILDIAENGAIGLEKYKSKKYDLVLSDIMMPEMNGLEMSKKIREIDKDQEIIIVSAYTEIEYFMESIQIGISGYITKPMDFDQMNEAFYRSATKINAIKEVEEYKLHLIEKVEERTSDLNKSIEKERVLQIQRIDNYEKTIYSFIEMVEKRDSYTAGHSERVANYSKMIAEFMGYNALDCEKLYKAAMLHDIGKVATPDAVLLKPGKLNNLEYKLIKEHVVTSYNLLKKIPMYEELAEIIRHHHERFDGNGYPNGLAREDIPPLSRILILADAFDAMSTNRIYKGRKNLSDSIKEVQELKEAQFDPKVVEAAIKVLSNIEINLDVNQLPETDLEEERFAYFFKDLLTDLYSKNYLELILNKNKKYRYMYVVLMENFTQYNKRFSWKDGDKMLCDVATLLKKTYFDSLIFRIYGDDFILLSDKSLSINSEQLKIIDNYKESKITFRIKEFDLLSMEINDLDELENLIL